MITFCGKQVIVVGVNDTGEIATVHYAEALGRSGEVPVSKLRSDTMQELQDALIDAPVLA